MSQVKENTFHIGPIRPPSEAHSLLLQVTAGCTWNKCKFCDLYRHTNFKAYTVNDIKEDIDAMARLRDIAKTHKHADGSWDQMGAQMEMDTMSEEEQHCYWMILNWLMRGGKHVFLQDGNTLALTASRLTEVLGYLKKQFPTIERITSYGRADTLSRVSEDEYKALREAGLTRVHSGFESGSDAVLKKIKKGITQEQEITAGQNIRAAGIEFSMYFMPGVGGRELTRENAEETAKVIREVNPDFVRVRTAVLKRGSDLWQDYIDGNYIPCSENEKVRELRTVIAMCEGCSGRIVSDHIINLVQTLGGSLMGDREALLSLLDGYLNMPEERQRIYQLARRSGLLNSPTQLDELGAGQLERFAQITNSVPAGDQWEMYLNDMMNAYI